MVLNKLREKVLSKKQTEGEPEGDWLELPEAASDEQKVPVRIDVLQNVADTERIQQLVRDGNVVFLRIKDLRTKDIAELKRAVERLKKTVQASNGDLVGVDEDFLIITPNFARVHR